MQSSDRAFDNNIPDLMLEQYVLGELSKDKSLMIQQLLLESIDLRARLDEIKKSNKAFSLPLNHARVNHESKKIKENFSGFKQFVHNKGFRLAFVSCFLVLIASPFLKPVPNSDMAYVELDSANVIRLKGIQPQLQIFRKRGLEIEQLFNKDYVRSSDSLQLSYIGAGDKFGVIFSVDGGGGVTLHYPESASKSPRIKSNSVTPLPYAYDLDNAPDFERFFLVTSKNQLDVDEIIKQGNELARDSGNAKSKELMLLDDVKQTSILLTKVEK